MLFFIRAGRRKARGGQRAALESLGALAMGIRGSTEQREAGRHVLDPHRGGGIISGSHAARQRAAREQADSNRAMKELNRFYKGKPVSTRVPLLWKRDLAQLKESFLLHVRRYEITTFREFLQFLEEEQKLVLDESQLKLLLENLFPEQEERNLWARTTIFTREG